MLNAEIFVPTWWVLLIGVGICFVVGILWYGPLFGRQWMKAANITQEDISSGSQIAPVLSSLVASLIWTYVLTVAINLAAVQTIWGALLVAALGWVGFHAVQVWNHISYDGRPRSLFFITTLYDLVVLLLTAIVIYLVG